jgi:hypothetical protein
MSNSPSLDVVTLLSEGVGGFGNDEQWVRQVLTLFPIPAPPDATALFTAIQRISNEVPWLFDALGGDEFAAPLARTIARVAAKWKVDRLTAEARLHGTYDLAGALVGSDSRIMPGPEMLRAALLACCWRWARADEVNGTAVRVWASAIRSVVKKRDHAATVRHPVARHVTYIAQSTSLPDFIERADVLSTCEQKGIRDAWAGHFKEELVRLAGSPTATEEPPPSVPKTQPKTKRKQREFDEDDVLDALVDPVRYVTAPPPEGSELAEGEPTEEVSSTQLICPIDPKAKSRERKRLASHQALQAIWCSNYLLLTNHPDVLPEPDLAAVVRCLLEELATEQPAPASPLDLALLLIQAMTGRTSKTLPAVRQVEQHSPNMKAGDCELCLQTGMLRMGIFWKRPKDKSDPNPAAYFSPSDEQQLLLEPTVDCIDLPLPPRIRDALRRHSRQLGGLVSMQPDVIDTGLRSAARHVSEKIGLRISPGQVRRSFAAHVFEKCRDTALTQLIAGDTLGQSTNPLHYFSPTRVHVAEAYWKSLSLLSGSDEKMPSIANADSRVGASLLVRFDVAREMAMAPSAILNKGVKCLVDGGESWKVHEAMVNHLACMLLAIAGHRGVNALFKLTLGGLDASRGAGLFSDKVHDGAHNPRLASLPTCLMDQIGEYLAHLQGLAQIYPALSKRVGRILEGRAPMLFHITPEGHAVKLRLDSWKVTLPECWRVLPLYWGRLWIRTRAVELGLRPELASIDLGHLEAVGYPFSSGGPTDPEAFVRATRPFLDKAAAQQGWQVRRGIPSQERARATAQRPLRSWNAHVARHEQTLRDEQKAWRLAQRAQMKRYREQAEKDVLSHPVIATSSIPATYTLKVGPWLVHDVLLQKAERVRDDLYETAGNNLALGLARSEALFRILKKVNKRIGISGQEPGRLISLRRPLDNAFVPDMMIAVRQVDALRAWVIEQGKKPPRSAGFAQACARTALSLALFGFFDAPDQILDVLGNRTACVRSAMFEGTVFVPWGEAKDQTAVLRDLASLALGKLAKKYRLQALPSRVAINGALADLLPKWAVPVDARESTESPEKDKRPRPDLLQKLCETVSVCNRYELSSAARMVRDRAHGSISAPLREQLAMIDGDPPGSFSRDWEMQSTPDAPAASLIAPSGKGSARSQYLSLCAVLPNTGTKLKLPLTGQMVPAANLFSPGTREKVIAEIQQMLETHDPKRVLQPIVRMLATWVLQMLIEGTQARKDPADSTIRTYLMRIGSDLVAIFGKSSLANIDGTELEKSYITVIKLNKSMSDDAAAAILSFHDCCAPGFWLPEIDLAEVRSYLNSDRRSVDAHLILPGERDASVAMLLEQARDGGFDAMSRQRSRLVRQAGAAMPWYAFGAARRSEVLGVKFQDVSLRGGYTRMRIRANSSRRLKTDAARRTLDVSQAVSSAVNDHIANWVATDRSRLQPSRSSRAFVFSSLEEPRSAEGRNEIAATCQHALAAATGRPVERLHRLRHLVAFERTTPPFLCPDDLAALSRTALRGQTLDQQSDVVLPRDLMERVVTMGHAHWSTTLVCYHHFPWLLSSRAQARLREVYLKRFGAASVMGIGVTFVDGITQEALKAADHATVDIFRKTKGVPRTPEARDAQGKFEARAWMDHVLRRRVVPVSPARPEAEVVRPPHQWTAWELGGLLDRVDRLGSLDTAVSQAGGHPEDAQRIRESMAPFELRLGRRLAGEAIDEGSELPKWVARQPPADSALRQLWKAFDEDPAFASEVAAVAALVYDAMHPKHADRIRIRQNMSDRLREILRTMGAKEQDVELTSLPNGMCEVRVARTRSKLIAAQGSRQERFDGIAIKRTIGIAWLAQRLQQEAQEAVRSEIQAARAC